MKRVLIIGGGIGGLALAQGLRRAGVPVTVFERTVRRTDWLQGYRIHINPHGSGALRACLDPANWQSFVDTVSKEDAGFAFTTEQMKTLLEFDSAVINPETDPAKRHHGVSRITLREILLSGMDDVVEYGKTFVGYQENLDGSVTARFADGTTAVGDLLIGADGANSRVRAQLLPHAERVDTGVVAIAGKHPLTGLPPELASRVNLVLPRGDGNLFTAIWKADKRTASDGDYALWGYANAASRFPDLEDRDLREVVLEKMHGWSPMLRDLIANSDPATINVVRMRSAALVKPWPTGPVTLMGDAIHSMTPMAGIGANTALRDADLLRRRLIEVQQGASLTEAVAAYEDEMRRYSYAAVKLSHRNARQAASGNVLGRLGFRGMLRLVNAVPPLRRGMARSFGS
jgi:2-polyprenyl-6-methoxyphenol hydroxylase-like FAD-dependent oxidoreductase